MAVLKSTPVIIGTPQNGSTNNGGDITLTFNVVPSRGDVVIVFGGHGNATNTIGPSTAGYTALVSDTSTNAKFGVWRKIMGATPDTSVVCQGGGSNSDAVVYACWVWRGIDNVTPEDVTTTTANGASGAPNNPSITPVTAGAVILAMAGSVVNDSSPGSVTSATDSVTYNPGPGGNFTDTNPYTANGCYRILPTATLDDPGAWSLWSTSVWFAATVALRPATTPPGQTFGQAQLPEQLRPIPRARPDHLSPSLALTYVVVAQPPFAQSDWPNPVIVPKLRQYQVPDSDFTLLLTWDRASLPSGVTNWGDSAQPRLWQRPGFTLSNRLYDQPDTTNLPASSDWKLPNPIRRMSDYNWTRSISLALTAPVQTPFYQSDWPLPRPRVVMRSQGWTSPALTILTAFDLGNLPSSNVWNNPTPLKKASPSFTAPTPLSLAAVVPTDTTNLPSGMIGDGNADGRRPAAQQRSPVNIMPLLTASPPVQGPFKNLDWPLPRGRARVQFPIDQVSLALTTVYSFRAVLGAFRRPQPQSVRVDYQNLIPLLTATVTPPDTTNLPAGLVGDNTAVARRAAQQPVPQNLMPLLTAIPPVQTPFKPFDWPTPRGRHRMQVPVDQPSLALTTVYSVRAVLRAPPRPMPLLAKFEHRNIMPLLTAPPPADSANLPAGIVGGDEARRPASAQQQQPQNTIPLLTATPPVQPPFHQNDWPTPQRQKRNPADWIVQAIALGVPVPPPAPAHWPNAPRAAQPMVKDWLQPGLSLLTSIPPVQLPVGTPAHWPNPSLGARRLRLDWATPSLTLATSLDQTNVPALTVWSAQFPRRSHQFFIAGTALALVTPPPPQPPFFQTDWPNPVRAKRNPADWVTQAIALSVPVPPAAPPHWPNAPRGAQRPVQDWSTPSLALATSVSLPVGTPTHWPNPVLAKKNPADWVKQSVALSIPVPPLAPMHWPNPRGWPVPRYQHLFGPNTRALVSGAQTLGPALWDDGDTFYLHTLSVGPVTLDVALYTDADGFYGHQINLNLAPQKYTDPDTIYSAVLTQTLGLQPSLFADPDTFYDHDILNGEVILHPGYFADPDTFYHHRIGRPRKPPGPRGGVFVDVSNVRTGPNDVRSNDPKNTRR